MSEVQKPPIFLKIAHWRSDAKILELRPDKEDCTAFIDVKGVTGKIDCKVQHHRRLSSAAFNRLL